MATVCQWTVEPTSTDASLMLVGSNGPGHKSDNDDDINGHYHGSGTAHFVSFATACFKGSNERRMSLRLENEDQPDRMECARVVPPFEIDRSDMKYFIRWVSFHQRCTPQCTAQWQTCCKIFLDYQPRSIYDDINPWGIPRRRRPADINTYESELPRINIVHS